MMKPRRRLNPQEDRNDAGFTMVEVLIALFIFVFGILALGSMQITAMRTNLRARQITEASTLATQQIERLMGTAYEDLADGNAAADGATLNWTVTTDDPIPNTATIVMNITLSGSRNPVTRQYVYHITRKI